MNGTFSIHGRGDKCIHFSCNSLRGKATGGNWTRFSWLSMGSSSLVKSNGLSYSIKGDWQLSN
jgi:hypothetical protein